MAHDNFFDSKRSGEIVTVTFELSPVLATGETITGSNWSVEVIDGPGADPSPNNLLFGSPSTSGSKVSHLIQGGIDQVVYRIIAAVNTSAGQTIHAKGLIEIDDEE